MKRQTTYAFGVLTILIIVSLNILIVKKKMMEEGKVQSPASAVETVKRPVSIPLPNGHIPPDRTVPISVSDITDEERNRSWGEYALTFLRSIVPQTQSPYWRDRIDQAEGLFKEKDPEASAAIQRLLEDMKRNGWQRDRAIDILEGWKKSLGEEK